MSGIIRKKLPGEAWETVVDDGSSDSGGILTASKDLTSAQIADLGDTPVEIIAAIPGRAIICVGGAFAYFAGTEPFGGGLEAALKTGDGSLCSFGGALGTDDAIYQGTPDAQPTVSGAALVIQNDGTPGYTGTILTASLADDNGGSQWVPGDTAVVGDDSEHNPDGIVTVSTVTNSFVINQVNQGAKTFRLTGDATAFQAGDDLLVYRSTGNDDTYPIDTVGAFTGGNTLITLDGGASIPSAVADGRAGDDTLGGVGAIDTFAITDGGGQYALSEYELFAEAPSAGESAGIEVTAVSELSDGTARVTVYYATV